MLFAISTMSTEYSNKNIPKNKYIWVYNVHFTHYKVHLNWIDLFADQSSIGITLK